MTKAHASRLVKDYQEGKRGAGDRLYKEMTPLIRLAAKDFSMNGVEPCELFSVATVGLLQAADRYDGRGAFSPYAFKRMRWAIVHYLRFEWPLIRQSQHVYAKALDGDEGAIIAIDASQRVEGSSSVTDQEDLSHRGVDAMIAFNDQISRWEPSLRQTAVMMVHGYNTVEIGRRLGMSKQSGQHYCSIVRKRLRPFLLEDE